MLEEKPRKVDLIPPGLLEELEELPVEELVRRERQARRRYLEEAVCGADPRPPRHLAQKE